MTADYVEINVEDLERYVAELLHMAMQAPDDSSDIPQEITLQELLASPLPDYLPVIAAVQLKMAFAVLLYTLETPAEFKRSVIKVKEMIGEINKKEGR